jgi:hypothetical protein
MMDKDMTERKSGTDGVILDYPKIEAMVGQLANAIAQSKASAPDSGDKIAALRIDYQTTVDVFKLLSDIRFRCLVFVTAIIAVANALLPGTGDPGTRIALGVVGFLTTLGITVYELRNSQLYEAAIHRAKILETRLSMVRAAEQTDKEGPFGLFNERPLYVENEYWRNLRPEERKTPKAPLMTFWSVQVKHDRGLALIYGAVLGGWVYLVADGILSLTLPNRLTRLISLILAFVAFLIFRKRFIYHDDNRFRQSAPEGRVPPA